MLNRAHLHFEGVALPQRRKSAHGAHCMILWRNMAIYLVPEAAARVWRMLSKALKKGGYLITGKAERPPEDLPLQRVTPCVHQRVEDQAWRNM